MTRNRLADASVVFGLSAYLLAFMVFLIAPLAVVVVVAFSAESYVAFPVENYSLRWFERFFEYKPFVNSFIRSMQVALLSALFGALLGVPAALAIVRSKTRSASAAMTFLLSPLSLPHIVLGFSLLFFLSLFGQGISFVSLVVAHTVVSLPYIVRTVAGLYRSVSLNLEETALVLGASRWQVFRHVTLPIIQPGVFAGCLLAILLSLDNLSVSLFFGGPSTNTLPVVMLSYMESQFDPSIAAASTIQLAVALLILVAVERVFGLRSLSIG